MTVATLLNIYLCYASLNCDRAPTAVPNQYIRAGTMATCPDSRVYYRDTCYCVPSRHVSAFERVKAIVRSQPQMYSRFTMDCSRVFPTATASRMGMVNYRPRLVNAVSVVNSYSPPVPVSLPGAAFRMGNPRSVSLTDSQFATGPSSSPHDVPAGSVQMKLNIVRESGEVGNRFPSQTGPLSTASQGNTVPGTGNAINPNSQLIGSLLPSPHGSTFGRIGRTGVVPNMQPIGTRLPTSHAGATGGSGNQHAQLNRPRSQGNTATPTGSSGSPNPQSILPSAPVNIVGGTTGIASPNQRPLGPLSPTSPLNTLDNAQTQQFLGPLIPNFEGRRGTIGLNSPPTGPLLPITPVTAIGSPNQVPTVPSVTNPNQQPFGQLPTVPNVGNPNQLLFGQPPTIPSAGNTNQLSFGQPPTIPSAGNTNQLSFGQPPTIPSSVNNQLSFGQPPTIPSAGNTNQLSFEQFPTAPTTGNTNQQPLSFPTVPHAGNTNQQPLSFPTSPMNTMTGINSRNPNELPLGFPLPTSQQGPNLPSPGTNMGQQQPLPPLPTGVQQQQLPPLPTGVQQQQLPPLPTGVRPIQPAFLNLSPSNEQISRMGILNYLQLLSRRLSPTQLVAEVRKLPPQTLLHIAKAMTPQQFAAMWHVITPDQRVALYPIKTQEMANLVRRQTSEESLLAFAQYLSMAQLMGFSDKYPELTADPTLGTGIFSDPNLGTTPISFGVTQLPGNNNKPDANTRRPNEGPSIAQPGSVIGTGSEMNQPFRVLTNPINTDSQAPPPETTVGNTGGTLQPTFGGRAGMPSGSGQPTFQGGIPTFPSGSVQPTSPVIVTPSPPGPYEKSTIPSDASSSKDSGFPTVPSSQLTGPSGGPVPGQLPGGQQQYITDPYTTTPSTSTETPSYQDSTTTVSTPSDPHSHNTKTPDSTGNFPDLSTGPRQPTSPFAPGIPSDPTLTGPSKGPTSPSFGLNFADISAGIADRFTQPPSPLDTTFGNNPLDNLQQDQKKLANVLRTSILLEAFKDKNDYKNICDNCNQNDTMTCYFPYKKSCSIYFMCVPDTDFTLVPQPMQCNVGLFWDEEQKTCNNMSLVQCNISMDPNMFPTVVVAPEEEEPGMGRAQGFRMGGTVVELMAELHKPMGSRPELIIESPSEQLTENLTVTTDPPPSPTTPFKQEIVTEKVTITTDPPPLSTTPSLLVPLPAPPPSTAVIQTRKPRHNGCPNNRKWVRYLDNCYLFSNETDDWYGAQMQCKSFDGYLARIYTKAENEYIRHYATNRPDDGDHIRGYWIGGSDLEQEGVWQWQETGKRIGPIFWHKSESNSPGVDEDCLVLVKSNNYEWDDEVCSYQRQFICKVTLK